MKQIAKARIIIHLGLTVTFVIALAVLSLLVSVSNADAQAEQIHGYYEPDTEVCAVCHNTHTATHGNLIKTLETYQADFCYTCHDGTGSIYNIQELFDNRAHHHPIKDQQYASDPNAQLDCSDCHDSHGSKKPDGSYYARAIRTIDNSSNIYYQGNDVCYACHQAGDTYDMDYFEDVPNAHNNTDPQQTEQFPDPDSGTQIKCSICHNSHGSNVRRLALDTDRNLCGQDLCHPDNSYTLTDDNEVIVGIGGGGTSWYEPKRDELQVFSQDTFSTPPTSLKGPREYRIAPNIFSNQPSDWQYNSMLQGVAVGDANNDGIKDVVAVKRLGTEKPLVLFPGKANDKGIGSPRYYPTVRSPYNPAIGDYLSNGYTNVALIYTWGANEVYLYTIIGDLITDTQILDLGAGTNTKEVAMGDVNSDGKNEIVAAHSGGFTILPQGTLNSSGGTNLSQLAVGDVNEDGKDDVVVGNSLTVSVFIQQNGTLVKSNTFSVSPSPQDIAIGNVIEAETGKEVIVTNGSYVRVYALDGSSYSYNNPYNLSTSKGGSYQVDTGDVNGDGKEDVTTTGMYTLAVFAQNASGTGLTTSPVYYWITQGTDVSHPIVIADIGNLHPYGHKTEVMPDDGCSECHDPHLVTKDNPVVGDGLEPLYRGVPTVERIDDSDPRVVYYEALWPPGTWETDYDITWYYYATVHNTSRQNNYAELTFTGKGISLIAYRYPRLGDSFATGKADIYIDGEFQAQIDYDQLPHLQRVVAFTDQNLSHGTHTIKVVCTGEGPTGTSKMITVDAFDVYNDIRYQTVESAEKEYQVCIKCHSSGADSQIGVHDIADEINPNNPSYHPIMASGTRPLAPLNWFVVGWGPASMVTCSDCHTQAEGSTNQIIHGSEYGNYLKKPYINVRAGAGWGTPNAESDVLLCYDCHSADYYRDKPYTFVGSFAYQAGANTWTESGAHAYHVRRNFHCATCHDVHGSSRSPGMLREELDLREENGWRRCNGVCHR